MIRRRLLPFLLQWAGAVMCGKAVLSAYYLGGFGLAGLAFLAVLCGVQIVGAVLRDRGWRR